MKETLLTYIKLVNDYHLKVERNEAAARHSLIGPLFTRLGYDLADPQECRPEFKADFGRGVRAATPVDWAFFVNGNLAFFVEAKAAGAQLARYDEQLGMYFAKAPGVKLGILTNGTHWRFFSDLVHLNLMDMEPFFIWDVLNHDPERALGLLTILQKSQFTPQRIRKFAERKHHQVPPDPPTVPGPLTTQDGLIDYLHSKQAEHGMTPLVLKKVKFLNPDGIKNGVFYMVSLGGQGDKKMRPKLQAILPPGTVIRVKWVKLPPEETAAADEQTQDAPEQPPHPRENQPAPRSGSPLIEWIVTAFRNLGGRAHLRDGYKEVRRLGYDGGGEDLNKLIRARIYEHSSESPKFTGNPNDDLFRRQGEGRSGIWELREGQRHH